LRLLDGRKLIVLRWSLQANDAQLVDPADAHELADIARELGADVLEGTLRYPSATNGWQLGDIDLSENLDRYRDQRLVLIVAPIGEAEPATYTCGVCGFVMNEVAGVSEVYDGYRGAGCGA
jgi:hypothetical protein